MYLNDVWVTCEDQRTTIIRHMFKGDWTTCSKLMEYSALNSEHSRGDLCIVDVSVIGFLFCVLSLPSMRFIQVLHEQIYDDAPTKVGPPLM